MSSMDSDIKALLNGLASTDPRQISGRIAAIDLLDDKDDPLRDYVRAWVQLQQAIIHNPAPNLHDRHDTTERLAYADKLEKLPHRNPKDIPDAYEKAFPGLRGVAYHPQERAEFIRAQIKLDELEQNEELHKPQAEKLQQTEQRLMRKYGKAWFNLAAGRPEKDDMMAVFSNRSQNRVTSNDNAIYHRGFVYRLTIGGTELRALSGEEKHPDIAEPLTHLVLLRHNASQNPEPETSGGMMESLRNAPWLSRIRYFCCSRMGNQHIAELLAAGHMPNVETGDLYIEIEDVDMLKHGTRALGMKPFVLPGEDPNAPYNPHPETVRVFEEARKRFTPAPAATLADDPVTTQDKELGEEL